MAYDRDRFVTGNVLHYQFQITQVIWKPVPITGPLGATESAPIWRNDIPVLWKRICKKLEGRAAIGPTVQQHQHRRGRIAPTIKFIPQPADLQMRYA